MLRPSEPEEIARALGQVSVVPGGYKCRCPAHEDKNASLQINTFGSKDGRPTIHCHAGCSPAKVYQAIETTTGMCFKGREERSSDKQKKEPSMLPAPIDWRPMKLGVLAPTKHWEYCDANGALLYVVARYDMPDGSKQIRPWHVVERNGNLVWVAKKPDIVSPLYRLPELIARPDAPVLIVEGEKAADAARTLPEFADYVVTTFQGGVKNWKKTDWQPVRGRRIFLWPDNDEAGRKGMYDLAKMLNIDQFCAGVKVAYVPKKFPEKWDLADPLPQNCSYVDVSWADAPQGGEQDVIDSITPANYIEAFDSMYWLMYNGRHRFTIRKQFWVYNQGRVLPLETAQIAQITRQHGHYVTCFIGNESALVSWADIRMRDHKYVSGFRFRPDVDEPIIHENNEMFINTFTGFRYEPEMVGNADIIKNHFLHIVCSGDENAYNYLWNFLAHMFQYPEDKPNVMLVFKGEQGTGKSVIYRILMELMGGLHGYASKVETTDQVTGKFNAVVCNKLLLWVEEMEITKSRTKENRLKTLITDTTTHVERKGKDSYDDVSYIRVMGSTNHEHIWNTTSDDRRLSVFDVSSARRGDFEYFSALEKAYHDPETMQRLMYELKNHDVNMALVKTPLVNQAKAEQKFYTTSPVSELALRMLRDGEIILKVLDERKDVVMYQGISRDFWNNGEVVMSSPVARRVLDHMIAVGNYGETRFSAKDPRATVAGLARQLGCKEINDGTRTRLQTRNVNFTERGSQALDNGYVIPTLQKAREAFCALNNLNYEKVFGDTEEKIIQFPGKQAQGEVPF